MEPETYRTIHFAIRDMLAARKSYPDTYTDDRIIVMAILAASIVQPEAPVRAVYQAARTELLRGMAEEGAI